MTLDKFHCSSRNDPTDQGRVNDVTNQSTNMLSNIIIQIFIWLSSVNISQYLNHLLNNTKKETAFKSEVHIFLLTGSRNNNIR